jgi:aspartate aminotransferase-like enzyme
VNLLAPGERIVVAHAGKFGERWLDLARAYGIDCRSLARPWGERIQPHDLARHLRETGPVSAVFLTHSETSTGVVHDVSSLARVVREHGDALVVVDAVSSAGAIPLRMDDWQLDACVSASHKGLLCPPGLAFVALGARARKRLTQPTLPRFYFDLRPALDGLDAGGTPWTPAVSLAHALHASLALLSGAELEKAWARTRLLARATRAGVQAAGLGLFASPPGDVVTAATVSGALDARQLVRGLRERGFEVAAGQSSIKREVFRIAHLGSITDSDLLALMGALSRCMESLGAAPAADPRHAARAVLDGAVAEQAPSPCAS